MLKCRLSGVRTFEHPKVTHEQYATPVDIAALIVHIAETQYSDIYGKSVLDMCCGTGILGIAASYFGPSYVLGIDIDKDALDIASENYRLYGNIDADLIQADMRSLALGMVDTTIMNPPFGTRSVHADVEAVRTALQCSSVVYSLHKTSTRSHLLRKFEGVILGEIKFEIPSIYQFHKKQLHYISVDLFRFTGKSDLVAAKTLPKKYHT